MKLSFWIILVIIAGGLVSVQGGVNSQLGKFLNQPLQAALISFLVGIAGVSIAIIAMNTGLPKLSTIMATPKYLFFGGLCGAVFITLSIIVIPKIGVANFLVAVICGEMIMSLIIDHYGWFDVPIEPVSISRFVGVLLVLAGVVVMNKSNLV